MSISKLKLFFMVQSIHAEKKYCRHFMGWAQCNKKQNTNKIYVCDIFINEFMQPSSRQYGRIHYNETVSFFCHTKQKQKNETDEREPINFSYIAWTLRPLLHFYGQKYALFAMLKYTNRMVNFHFGFCLWPMAIVFAMTSPNNMRLSRMIACFMRAINTAMTDIIQHQHAKRHFFRFFLFDLPVHKQNSV